MTSAKLDNYAQSYGSLAVHKSMLLDRTRTDLYFQAIKSNSHLFHDKIVMDLGAGTGILSQLIALHTKPKKIIAVEVNPVMARLVNQISIANQTEDLITVLNSYVEDLIDLPSQEREFEKVDIIVSEWMGQYLLHESMLDSVIFARDHFLAPGGLLFPDKAEILATLAHVSEVFYQHSGWMKDTERFHGVSIEPLADVFAEFLDPIVIESIADDDNSAFADHLVLAAFDLYKVQPEELIAFQVQKTVTVRRCHLANAFLLWFTVTFPGGLVLSTAPGTETHWKQTVILWPDSVELDQDSQLQLNATFRRTQPQERNYTINLELS